MLNTPSASSLLSHILPPPPLPVLQVFTETLEAMDRVEDLCTYLFTALERIAAPVEWSHVDVFQQAEALLVRGGESGRGSGLLLVRGGESGPDSGSLSSWLCECSRAAASLLQYRI